MTLYNTPANRFVAGFIGSPSMNFVEGRLEGQGTGAAFVAPGVHAALSPALAARVAGRVGQAVTLGIRPEDLYLANVPQDRPRALQLDLDAVEPMGNEIVLYARRASIDVVARVEPQAVPEPGRPVSLAVDLDKVHLFDAETGVSLTAGAAEVAA